MKSRNFLVLTLALTACGGGGRSGNSTSEVDRAVYLIDSGQYNEAISTMAAYQEQAPEDLRSRLVLASGHAARAGVRIADFEQFSNEIIRMDVSPSVAPTGAVDADLLALNKMFGQFYAVTRLLKAIPNLQGEAQVRDLKMAITILGGASKVYGGTSLYRGMLKIVLFKDNFLHHYRRPRAEKCRVSRGDILDLLAVMTVDLVPALWDVGFGFKDETKRDKVLKIAAIFQQVGLVTQQQRDLRQNFDLFPGALEDILPQCR